MKISKKEGELVRGIDIVFGNLEMRGFGNLNKKESNEKEYKISREGLAFGELLWYLYDIPIREKTKNNSNYQEVYKTKFKLSKNIFGWTIIKSQLFSYYLFIVWGIALFSLEILRITGLLNDLKEWAIFKNDFISLNFYIFVIISPFLLFTATLILDYCYKIMWINKKVKKIENNQFKLKNS
jgi:hypothetical protein